MANAKAYALLAYLCLCRGGRATITDIVDLLWPATLPAKGRHSLSQVVYSIRKLPLQAPLLERCGDKICMATDLLEIDVLTFQARVREAQWRIAVEMYGGAFLEGLDVAADDRFETWRDAVEGELHALHTKCIDALIEQSRVEVPASVEEWTRTALALRPLDGRVAQIHFRAIAEQGRLTEAEMGALEYLRRHGGDIAEEESGSIRKLCESIRSTGTTRGVGPASSSVRFVGRADELQVLRERWVQSLSSGAICIVLNGDPGIGKTRLLEQLARFAAIRGARVVSAAASPAIRRIPYTITCDLISELLDAENDLYPSLAELLGGRRSTLTTLEDSPHHLLFREAERLLSNRAASQPLLICVDDLQWVDDTSYEVLQYLASRARQTRVCFAFTARPEGQSRIDGLRLSCDCMVQQLDPLDTVGAGELLAAYCAATGRSLSHRDTAMLVSRAAGNPLFLLALADDSGRAGVTGSSSFPDSVRALIADRTRRLSTLAQDVLRILSALRSAESVDVVARIRGVSPLRVARAVEELAHLGLIRDRGGSVEPAHDLVADVVYAAIPASVCRLLHKNVLAVLCDRGNAFVAEHARCAGEYSEAYRAALGAFREAQAMRAMTEAEFYVELAAEVAQTLAEKEYAATEYVAYMCSQDAPYKAMPYVQWARERFHANDDPVGLLRCAAVEVDHAVREGTAPLHDVSSRASELVSQALATGDKRVVAEVASLVTRMAELGCDDSALAEWFALAVEVAREVDSDWAIPLLGKASVVAYLVIGPDEADRLSSSALGLAGQDPRHRALASAYRGAVLMLVGRLAEARDQFETTLQLARERGLEDAHFKASCNYAVIETDMGLYDAARRRLNGLYDDNPKNLVNIANYGFLGIECGDLALADWAVDELRRRSGALHAPMTETVAPVIAGLAAWERGEYQAAEQYASLVDPMVNSLSFQSDDSYGRILLGRTRGRRHPAEGIAALLKGSRTNRPAVPQLRVDFEAAKLLLELDGSAAMERLDDVWHRAVVMGVGPIAQRAHDLLNRSAARSKTQVGRPVSE